MWEMSMKTDLVICSDLHLRSDVPRCRDESEFHQAMLDKLVQIKNVVNKNKCPLVVAGDIGHKPVKTWTVWLLQKVISVFSEFEYPIYAIPGQHDLPNHSMENIDESGFGILIASGVINLLEFETLDCGSRLGYVFGFPFGKEIKDYSNNVDLQKGARKIAVVHKMVLENKPLWPGQEDPKASVLLKKYNYDLIISGDNHHSFMVEYKGKLLINSGSMMRQNSSQIDFKPRIYLWNGEQNKVKEHYLKIDENAVSTEFVDKEKEKENRMEALVQSLSDDTKEYETGLDFEENSRTHIKVNKIEKSVALKMEESINEGRGR